jgi:ATP-dependent DNA helicase RecQ
MPTLTPPQTSLPDLLHQVFGHTSFRPHQQQVCEAAASGKDVLLVMPTGAGKSLCYQLPAIARGGTALVISPLIALMDDQSSKLAALGLSVATIHSGRDREASRQACRDYLDGALDFLFIAPERLRVPGFPEMLAKRKPALVAIDEAHCISQWGHDFRPDYRTLGNYLPQLRPAPIIALTATATPTVQRDIAVQLNLQNPAIFITGFRRHNLAVEVVELSKPQRPDFALKLLKSPEARPAILYTSSRKDATEYAEKLHKHFPTAAYHAGLDAGTRDRVQRAFLSGKLDVVVATVAFGMGVDKADVRTVIHVALPASVEAYYQEIGRAGRDGKPSRTVLLHGFADRRLQEFFLEKNYPPTSELESVAAVLPTTYTPVNDLHNALIKRALADKKKQAASQTPIDRETLDRALEKLLIAGLAQMDMAGDVRINPDLSPSENCHPERSEGPASRSSPHQTPSRAPWQTTYESQVAARRAQIDRMIAFAESNECRMRMLVQHFGDTSDTARSCGLCDICNPSGQATPGGQPSANAAHQPTQQEREWLREILKSLENRSTSTGKLFTDLHLTKDRNDFDTLLEALARAGLITLTNDTFRTPEGIDRTYKKAAITHEGREPDDATLNTVWIRGSLSAAPSAKQRSATKSGAPLTRQASGRVGGVSQEPNPAAEALFDRLKSWRTETARPTKTPAFMILSDTVMRAIAHHAPTTLTALHAVPGMGPAKVDRYGAAILAVICGEQPLTSGIPPLKTQSRSSQHSTPPSLFTGTPPDDDSVYGAHIATYAAEDTNDDPEAYSTALDSPRPAPVLSSRPQRSGVERPLYSSAPPQIPRIGQAPHAVRQNKPTPPPPPPTTLTPTQEALDAKLRDWRKQQAAKAGLPSFFILSDTALRNIVLAAPKSTDDLRHVRGIDTEKLNRYGQDVVTLCTA